MEYLDQSGLYALEDLLVDLSKENKKVYFIHLPKQPRYMMERIGLVPRLVSKENIFDELPDLFNKIKYDLESILGGLLLKIELIP